MYNSIQYLRGLAALLVVGFHAFQPARDLPAPVSGVLVFGAGGVDLFFIISGFVIYTSQIGRNDGVGYFLYRRAIRIIPLYWAITLFMVFAHLTLGVFDDLSVDPGHILKSLAFIPHASPSDPRMIAPVLIPGWTLNYEIFFYAVFALAMAVAPAGRRMAVLAAAILGLVALGLVLRPASPIPAAYTSLLLLEFLAGVAIAAWVHRGGLRGSPALCWLPILGFVMFASTDAFSYDRERWRVLDWGVPSAIIVIGALAAELQGRLPTSRLFKLLGDASYSIYLTHAITHGVVRMVWRELGLDTTNAAMFAIYVAVLVVSAVLVGVASYYVIERPSLRLLQGLWRRRREAPATA